MTIKDSRFIQMVRDGSKPNALTYQNNRYIVIINNNEPMTMNTTGIKMTVRRYDGLPIVNHWADVQSIKSELLGDEVTAIEYYPPQSEVSGEPNTHYFWVLPPEVLPLRATALNFGQ